MDVEHLRKALKLTWLNYYRTNRAWLVRLGIWVNYEEARRPSASFILGTLSVAEPELIQLLPLVVDLNANPDRIVAALGLNFNPEDELEALEKSIARRAMQPPPKMLPSKQQPPFEPALIPVNQPVNQPVIQVEVTQPSHQSASRPARAKLPTKTPTKLSPKPDRPTLDTAQLSSQELPDRI